MQIGVTEQFLFYEKNQVVSQKIDFIEQNLLIQYLLLLPLNRENGNFTKQCQFFYYKLYFFHKK